MPGREGLPTEKTLKSKKEAWKTDCLAGDIMELCQDQHSRGFYRKVAALMPDTDIYRTVSEVRQTMTAGYLRTTPGKLFTWLILRRAAEQGIPLRNRAVVYSGCPPAKTGPGWAPARKTGTEVSRRQNTPVAPVKVIPLEKFRSPEAVQLARQELGKIFAMLGG